MTIMATATKELNVNTLLQRSLQLAGLMPMEQAASGSQWEARAAFGRDILEVVLDHVQAEGNVTRDMGFYEVTLTAGTTTYTMPTDTLRVLGMAMYCEDPSTDTIQLQVTSVDRQEYQLISNKDQQGRPTKYYPARDGAVTLSLWMVPDTTGAVLTVQRERLLADVSDPAATVDLERSWSKYLMWELAHHMAVAGGQEVARCGYLRSGADKAYAACKSTSTQSQPDQMWVSHDAGVSR